MNDEQKDLVMGTVDREGFDYAFCDYSNFDFIKDAEFHEARKAYVEAAKKLKAIIGFNDY